MPYYAQSAYFPLPSTPQAAAPQQQQYAPPAAPPQVDQVYLRQQAQAQQQAYQQQQYLEQQNRQLAQQQYYQQQQQQYAAAEQQRAQQQQQLQYAQQQQAYAQQYQQPARQKSPVCQQAPATPQYKSSEYIPSGGVYSTGGAYNRPSLRRVPSRADINTAVENEEAPYQAFGQGLSVEQQRGLVSYNPYATYGQTEPQSPLRSQREPSEYAYEGLNPSSRQQRRSSYSQTNLAQSRDGNNNLPARSPARGRSPAPQKNYGGQGGAQAESAYFSIPNDLVYTQNNQQRAYTYATESRPVYASSSRTNQASTSTPYQLKPAAARALYAALSSENVRTALERDLTVGQQQTPAYYNGLKVQGNAFAVPSGQKYSEYNVEDLNGLRSVIDTQIR